MRAILFIPALALAACTHTSKVMDTGNGTYMISATAHNINGGMTRAKEAGYDDAQAFCGQSGKHAVLLDVQTDPAFVRNQKPNTDVHFRCE